MVPEKKFLIAVSLAVFLLALSGCAGLSQRTSISPEREAYLKDICEENNISWQWDQVLQVVTLTYRSARAKVMIGSDFVMIGEERISLSSPTRIVKSAAVVPLDFKPKVIDRLHAEAAKKKGFAVLKARRIIIDAGHGGKDPGAIGYSGLQEKGIVLDICRQLKKILQKRGFDVELTREDDQFISLSERTLMASEQNADLFVSIHANASKGRNAYGIEVYASEELGFLDRIEAQRKVNETCLFGRLAMKRNDPDVQRIISDMLYEKKLSESDRLAEDISKRASRFVRTKNRGAKTERFFVLRNTLVPAILIEVGFLSNPKEERLLETAAYRQQIAQSLAEGIEDYANGTR